MTRRLVLKKICFSAWASTLNMGLINKGLYGMFVACGIWCLADVSSVSPSSERTCFYMTTTCHKIKLVMKRKSFLGHYVVR